MEKRDSIQAPRERGGEKREKEQDDRHRRETFSSDKKRGKQTATRERAHFT